MERTDNQQSVTAAAEATSNQHNATVEATDDNNLSPKNLSPSINSSGGSGSATSTSRAAEFADLLLLADKAIEMSSSAKSEIQEDKKKVPEEPIINRLYAFDFDHTIIETNSDYAVQDLLKNGVPEEITNFYNSTKNFTAFMDKIMQHMASVGITIEDIRNFMKGLKFVPGMEQLLQDIIKLRESNPSNHFIIISDANDFFINTILSNANPPIVVNELFTNFGLLPQSQSKSPKRPKPSASSSESEKSEGSSSSVGDDEDSEAAKSSSSVSDDSDESQSKSNNYLKIRPYDNQTDCPICPRNLCKGKVLQDYTRKNGHFKEIYYFGDGHNDVCPALHLSSTDTLFVRKGFSLEKIIRAQSINGRKVQLSCKTEFWTDANDIIASMKDS